jgi:hypothetical protein
MSEVRPKSQAATGLDTHRAARWVIGQPSTWSRPGTWSRPSTWSRSKTLRTTRITVVLPAIVKEPPRAANGPQTLRVTIRPAARAVGGGRSNAAARREVLRASCRYGTRAAVEPSLNWTGLKAAQGRT